MKLTAITCTGFRPEAFHFCHLWMSRQTKRPDEWIVVDDSLGSIPKEDYIRPEDSSLVDLIIRPELPWRLGDNTQPRNLAVALKQATGDVIAFIEDDDYYSPGYLEWAYSKIKEGYEAVGEAQAFYYHLPTHKYKRLRNYSFATLSQTTIHRNLLPVMEGVIRDYEDKLDYRFWNRVKKDKFLFPLSERSVGMKGMPGRPGLGAGHSSSGKEWQQDFGDLRKLQEMIGKDADYYRKLLRDLHEKESSKKEECSKDDCKNA